MPSSDLESILIEWRGSVSNHEINVLHAEAFDHPILDDDWNEQLQRLSLGWVTARDDQGLVGFVNIVWDRRAHAFVVDIAVASRARHRGIGVQLIQTARGYTTDAGCEWLHVDFEEHLHDFYLNACGFFPTTAGLMHLR
ncbi:GNAT family N-acetyltransferase [Microbacterium sp. NPDC056234]|uniref:GNAT family N-acetyltransferase n=1 Tax=Microbacterium sp. NPDC056234 TaxID=3345757 RepID=UPI0035DEFD74